MTVKYSQYATRPWETIGTTIGTAGGTATLIGTPGATGHIILDYLSYWLVDPAGSGTATLVYGTVSMPSVGLSSSRGAVSVPGDVLDANASLTFVTPAGNGSIGVWGRYLIAVED